MCSRRGRGRGLEQTELVMAEPSARYGHVAAGVQGKVYVWGGRRAEVHQVSHDGLYKAEIISSVDILDVKASLLLRAINESFTYHSTCCT